MSKKSRPILNRWNGKRWVEPRDKTIPEGEIAIGDRVEILNTTLSGRQIPEGIATILETSPTEGYYAVEFDEEPGVTYWRFAQKENLIPRWSAKESRQHSTS